MKKSKSWRLPPRYSENKRVPFDVAPDGVRFEINWGGFVVGASIFIPAINTVKLKNQVNKIAKHKNWRIDHSERIENGCWGVRFWRIL
jgi:hypothetical protein